jgi:cytochrome c biogenesis protein CcmG, thiol:disulfide interchange protein DsbE
MNTASGGVVAGRRCRRGHWLCLLAAATCLLGPTSDAQVAVGARAELALPSLEGVELTLASLRGSVTLVDFWATWCVPCRDSFPFYAELLERYGERGFEVVAVSVDTDRPALERFIARERLPFRVVVDASHEAVRTFQPEGMPASYLLDRRGVVRYVHVGFAPEDREGVEAQVRVLLDEEVPSGVAEQSVAAP